MSKFDRAMARRAFLALSAACFLLTWAAGALPQQLLAPIAQFVQRAPGARAFAQITPMPAAAATGLALALLFALVITFICIRTSVPAEARQKAFAGYTPFRKGLMVIAGLMLVVLPAFYEPPAPGEYRLAYAMDQLFARSHLAVSIFCAGVCIYTAAVFVFAWMVGAPTSMVAREMTI